ncbi:hypothetical protein ASPCAL15008 [Aspergillus calidoustus]|uniref:Uncharacterized protein n=1 Tax=Aspergillus calidoustus TaxID=454130 RepID=A0A0U5CKR0_ASPCI|nr:hypothetical protein ASPCAL15008 [Aspergillus calidoustus]
MRPLRQFDYHTISDVVMQARYTAVDGGATLRNTAISAVKKKLAGVEGSTMYALIDVKNEFPNEWFIMTRTASAVLKNKGQPSPPDTKASAVRLSLPQLNTKFPFGEQART